MKATPKRVLIAHQSTIPHYRVRFYELLEQMRPAHWEFMVAYDTRESRSPTVYAEPVDHTAFQFPILDAPTSSFRVGNKRLLWQHIVRASSRFDAIVTDTHLSNIAYPVMSLHELHGVSRIFWGHVREINRPVTSLSGRISERFKRWLIMRSNYFLAYTDEHRRELENLGYDPSRITVVNNTIDVRAERECYMAQRPHRETIRQELGISDRKVLISVGRLNADKRIDYLLRSFEALLSHDSSYHLLLVGAGDLMPYVQNFAQRVGSEHITVCGAVTETEKLGRLFTASDLFVLPGLVGLGPIHAFCYDLPALVLDLKYHGPEIAYLNEGNSIKLPGDTTPEQFAQTIPNAISRFSNRAQRETIFPGIAHLTLENMAENFIAGIERAFSIDRRK